MIWNGLSGRSNVPLEKVLPRLRHLGVLEGAEWLEQSRRTKHLIETSGLMPVEINDIYGEAVDTENELNSINSWAANRKPTIFGGRLGSVPRTMGSLVINGKY